MRLFFTFFFAGYHDRRTTTLGRQQMLVPSSSGTKESCACQLFAPSRLCRAGRIAAQKGACRCTPTTGRRQCVQSLRHHLESAGVFVSLPVLERLASTLPPWLQAAPKASVRGPPSRTSSEGRRERARWASASEKSSSRRGMADWRFGTPPCPLR